MTSEASAEGRLQLRAHAKLNLWLRVLAREESGYHSVETLLQRLELHDELTLTLIPVREIRLDVVGDSTVPADESNLCWRAAEALSRRHPDSGVHIRLHKRIPAGAGLGGGSADAAAVLVGLNRLWGDPFGPHELLDVAGELGSDVPFGLCPSEAALAWGRGRAFCRSIRRCGDPCSSSCRALRLRRAMRTAGWRRTGRRVWTRHQDRRSSRVRPASWTRPRPHSLASMISSRRSSAGTRSSSACATT